MMYKYIDNPIFIDISLYHSKDKISNIYSTNNMILINNNE